jgi:uncharacterized protein YggE
MAAAQSPVSTQPLAPGEVLLELNAIGTVTTRADTATLTISVDGVAPNALEARRQAESLADRAVAAAASAGVGSSDISRRPISTGQGAAMAMAMAEMRAAQRSGSARRGATPILPDTPGQSSENAHGEIEIRLHDLDRLPQLRRALEGAGIDEVPDPTYALTDDRAARAAARAQAIAQARANADAYASTLGMRVLRIVRVTERVGVDLIGTMFSEGARMRQMMGGMDGRNPDMNTTVTLGMDFALAPR